MWESGITVMEIADCAANLPVDSAVVRAVNPDYAWTVEAMLIAAAVDEMRDFHFHTLKHWGVKNLKRPDPIQRPGVKKNDDVEVDQVGASEGFESFAEADEWYERLFPGRLDPTTPQRRLPPRDSRGRFTKT